MGFRDLYDLISDCDARVSLSWLTWWNTHDFPEKKNLHSGLEQSMETFAIGIVDGDFTRNVLKDPGDFLEAIYGGGCNQPW